MRRAWDRLLTTLRRLTYVVFQNRREDDLAAELDFHRALKIDEHEARGVARRDAEALARRDMGNEVRARQAVREIWVWPALDIARQDLKHALRSFTHQPIMAVAIVATLALGIGATAVLVGVVEAVLVRQLPYRNPDRLVWIAEYIPALNVDTTFENVFVEWRARARTLESVAVFNVFDVDVTDSGGSTVNTRSVQISEPLSRVFGVQPALGRDFLPSEVSPTHGGTLDRALISDGFFRRRFGGDSRTLGRTVTIQNRPSVIIGVLPPRFRLPIQLSLRPGPQIEPEVVLNFVPRPPGGGFPVQVLARLRADATAVAAQRELESLTSAFRKSPAATPIRVVPLYERIVGGSRPGLIAVLGAVGFLWMAGCLNVAGLLIARSLTRGPEMAVRAALGASRRRLVFQLMAESVLLACAGGACGLVLAWLGLELVAKVGFVGIPRLQDAVLDSSVVWAATGLSMATAVVIGLGPAFFTSQLRPSRTLNEADRTTSAPRATRALQSGLVATQLALSLTLLVGAGLMMRSVAAANRIGAPFLPSHVVTFRAVNAGPESGTLKIGDATVIDDLARAIEDLPDVTAAAAWVNALNRFQVTDWPVARAGGAPEILQSPVTRNFLAASGVSLLAGRWFEERDGLTPGAVTVVTETAARVLLPPGENLRWLLGKRLGVSTIAGVVSDFTWRPESNALPEMFSLLPPNSRLSAVEFIVRTTSAPQPIATAVANVVSLRRGLGMTTPQTLDERIAAAVAPRQFHTAIFVALAATSLTLCAVGLFGILSFTINQRVREIGLRMALGAAPREVARLMLGRAARIVALGVIAGIAGATAGAFAMRSVLLGVVPFDAPTYGIACGVLIAAAAAATWIPIRRATRVAPIMALTSR